MSTNIGPKQLLDALHWRYATKVFDATKKIPAETWAVIEQTLVASPSSYGLQPYHFIVVTDPKKREELRSHAWNQRQVVDASHFVVFAARTRTTEAHVDTWLHRISGVRGVPVHTLKDYRGMMVGDLVNGPRSKWTHEWAARQAYIALGNVLTGAALLGVDACPMEGFVPAEFDRILGLDTSEFKSAVSCALGYRSAEDKYATLPKVRFETKDLVQTV